MEADKDIHKIKSWLIWFILIDVCNRNDHPNDTKRVFLISRSMLPFFQVAIFCSLCTPTHYLLIKKNIILEKLTNKDTNRKKKWVNIIPLMMEVDIGERYLNYKEKSCSTIFLIDLIALTSNWWGWGTFSRFFLGEGRSSFLPEVQIMSVSWPEPSTTRIRSWNMTVDS